MQPDDYALVIGINHYPAMEAKFQLQGAVADATDMRDWLQHSEGGALPPSNISLLVSAPAQPGTKPFPRKVDVDEALHDLLAKAEFGKPRRFYLYFSGHAFAEDSDRVALCMSNWSGKDAPNAALASYAHVEMLRRCTAFQEIVVFLDCCRTHRQRAIGLGPEKDCPKPHPTAGRKAQFVAHATRFLEPALEAAIPDAPEELPKRGLFTRALLGALRGGAADDSGGTTLGAIPDYVRGHVERLAQQSSFQQQPECIANHEARAVRLGRARPEAKFLIEFGPDRAWPVVLEGPSTQEIKRWDTAPSGAVIEVLAGGDHVLREPSTGRSVKIPFLPEGEVTRVRF